MPPTISDNEFTGYGLAVTYNDSPSPAAPSQVTFTGANNTVKAGDLAVRTFGRMTAGGSLGDVMLGSGAVADWMSGGGGNDTINAGNGSDYVIGGIGSDRIITGSGQDTMLYYETNEGGDTITDFAANNDTLAFRKDAFVPLGSTGTLPNANFSTNAAAITTVPTFLYTGGVLTYDADGLNTGAAGVNIATFSPTVPALTAANIVLF
jgi:Ca2+-binding RTX toxin-like protein